MQVHTLVKGLVFVVGIVGIAFSSLAVLDKFETQSYTTPLLPSAYIPEEYLVHPQSAESIERIVFGEQKKEGLPVRLIIPKINVAAVILSTGLTPDGAMDVPGSPDDVAWFDLGPRPGEHGSAVISGHFGWKNGRAAVFDNLHKLAVGDKISTEDESGVRTTFVVHGLRKLKEHEDAGAVFGSNDGGAHLNLITCGGTWDKAKKSYSDRLVVFADKVDEQ